MDSNAPKEANASAADPASGSALTTLAWVGFTFAALLVALAVLAVMPPL